MNYRHLYHAGNFADVFKHCILLMLVEALHQKEKPFCYLDTHAGIGYYDLTSELAQKTREYENGILRVYDQATEHTAIKTYQQIISEINSSLLKANNKAPQPALSFYPGSPAIVRALLRPQDSMILTELHPEDVLALKKYFVNDRQVAIHHADGYQSLKAFLPPKQGRGLIFIDPPFEQTNEFQQIITAMQIALQRYPIGIYLIWYPIKDNLQVKNFYKELQKLTCKNVLLAEITTNATRNNALENNGLTSCGVAIINAPWQFQPQLATIVTWLSEKLAVDTSGHYKIICQQGAN